MKEKNKKLSKLEKMGNYIKEARENKAKMTQEQLAENLGVNRQTVSKWERGVNAPDIMILKDICKVLKISVYDLLDGESKPKKYEPKDMSEIKLFNKKIYVRNSFKKAIMFLFSFLLFAIVEVGLYYGVSTYLYNERKWDMYELVTENDGEIHATGKIISNKEETFYNIDSLLYNSPYIHTDFEPMVKEIKISLYYDDAILITKSDIRDEPTRLSQCLDNKIIIYSTKKKKYIYNKDAELKVFIEYVDDKGDNSYRTAKLMLK